MPSTLASKDTRSWSELTHAYFGETLSIDQVLARLELVELPESGDDRVASTLWVASVGYERHRDHRAFAHHVAEAGIERLIDVRELPISRRRGFAKTALSDAMAEVGVEYVHMRALGNPKPFRDLYKSGRASEGRTRYAEYLLTEQADALRELVPMLRDKRSALMCLEHDPTFCHRTVILEALQSEIGLELEVAQIA